MNDEKWVSEGEGAELTYTKENVSIHWHPRAQGVIGARPYWEARHQGRAIKTDYDLQEVMDYCDKFLQRIA